MLAASCDTFLSGALVPEATSQAETRSLQGPDRHRMMDWHLHVMRQLDGIAAALQLPGHLGSVDLFLPPIGESLHHVSGHAELGIQGGLKRIER